LRRRIIWLAVMLSAGTHAAESERAWDFNLGQPGTYKVQVTHKLPADSKDFVPGVTKVGYSITIGHETQKREIYLVANQPFIPLITDVPSPQKMRVIITGLSATVLKSTEVYAYDASTVPPGEYFDPRKKNFPAAVAVRALLNQPAANLDLARAKLSIDKMIDPGIDTDSNLRRLDDMTASIRMLPEFGESQASKLLALKKYIYEPGAWNGFNAFEYDLKDPLGNNIHNKLLPTYLSTRKGNCVTMPLLVILLGQRLGIDVTAATAPKHVLVKWKNEGGTWVNLEATSGANPARDVWIRQQMPMTDEALANGVYLQPLTRTESAALIATTLAEHYFAQGEFEKSIVIADLVLQSYPKDVGMIVLKATAFGRLNRQWFVSKYPSPAQIPVAERGYFQYLSQNNRHWFAQAETLGWRQESAEDEQRYLESVDQARQRPTPNN
jgi:regulator of sirC expression with transglutaminase-like and TPR domain